MASSFSLLEFALAFVGVLLTLVYFTRKKNLKVGGKLPPGPPGLPLIGNLHQLGGVQTQLLKWAEEYGPIYRAKLGLMETIFLNDHKIIREVFQDMSSAGRVPNPVFMEFAGGNHGVIMSEEEHWETQRRFTLRKLRDFGFSKSSMEDQIVEEMNSMIQWFEKRLDKPIYGNRIFNGAVVNSLWKIISGEKQEWDAKEKPEMIKATEDLINAINYLSGTGLLALPFLRYIAPDYFGWSDFQKSVVKFRDLTNQSLNNHKKLFDPNNLKDFMDHYLMEIERTKDPNSSFYKETGGKNLTALIPDLFIAGSETTANTSSWTLFFLAKYQSKQRKLHEELDKVLGSDRKPSLQDRQFLVYTEAVILEVLRMSSLAVNGMPHRMTEDAVFQGYLFPKNATVMVNTYAAHYNADVWEDPKEFRPERFLSKDGLKIVNKERLVAFSLGKRQCLGKNLAEDTLLLFVSGIFQKFHIELYDEGETFIKLKPTTQMINVPEPFKIIVRLRESNE